MEPDNLPDWFDRHHVEVVRTQVTTLDGPGAGKYLARDKFLKSLPAGHAIADMALFMDLSGMPHLTFWHDERAGSLGDIFVRPDLATLISDGTDPDLGHCIGDFTDNEGNPLEVCPRSTLKRMVTRLDDLGYAMKATCELEFFLFHDSFDDVRRKNFRRLRPVGATHHQNIYMLKNAYHAAPFMKEVTARMNWKGIRWEGWSDEGGLGQIELNIEPADPVQVADNVVRIKQIIYEVAVDMGMSVTFMPRAGDQYGSGMHIHHSLTKDGEPAFFDPTADDNRTSVFRHWMGGLMAALPGAVSFLCPTINAYRRLAEFSGAPSAVNWGEENKTAALRVITSSPGASRIEYRIGSSDLNPYLALAVIIGSGIAGLTNELEPPGEFMRLGWGLPPDYPRLPNSMMRAAEALSECEPLRETLGANFVDYWIKSREHEWLSFHTEGGDPDSREVTEWEFKRYFELI